MCQDSRQEVYQAATQQKSQDECTNTNGLGKTSRLTVWQPVTGNIGVVVSGSIAYAVIVQDTTRYWHDAGTDAGWAVCLVYVFTVSTLGVGRYCDCRAIIPTYNLCYRSQGC